jgi:hypothetical protein
MLTLGASTAEEVVVLKINEKIMTNPTSANNREARLGKAST